MWWMYALGSALFASLTAITAKMGIKNLDTNLAIAIRTSFVLVMTWGMVFLGSGSAGFAQLTAHNWIFLAISGVTTGLSWIFYFKAISMGNVSQVAPVDKLSLALTIFFSVLFLGETISIKTAIGAALILAGTIVIIL